MGVLPPAFLVRITSVVTSTTVVIVEALKANTKDKEGKFGTNFFATGWKVRGVDCNTAANNGVELDITASTTSGQVTTAACTTGWASADLVMICTDEFSAMLDASSNTGAGTEFTITKIITKTTVIHTGTGLAITGAASGNVVLKRIALQNDNTICGGATSGVYVRSNDATTPLTEMLVATGATLDATDLGTGTTGFVASDIGYSVATGKILYLQAGTAALSGAGSLAVHMTFVRNADGATIAAA